MKVGEISWLAEPAGLPRPRFDVGPYPHQAHVETRHWLREVREAAAPAVDGADLAVESGSDLGDTHDLFHVHLPTHVGTLGAALLQ